MSRLDFDNLVHTFSMVRMTVNISINYSNVPPLIYLIINLVHTFSHSTGFVWSRDSAIPLYNIPPTNITLKLGLLFIKGGFARIFNPRL